MASLHLQGGALTRDKGEENGVRATKDRREGQDGRSRPTLLLLCPLYAAGFSLWANLCLKAYLWHPCLCKVQCLVCRDLSLHTVDTPKGMMSATHKSSRESRKESPPSWPVS